MQYHHTLSPRPFSIPKTPVPKTRLSCKPWFNSDWAFATTTKPDATLYDLLSVTESAGQDEIKAAFRKIARKWHPDTCRSENKDYFTKQFILAREAYRVLSDPVLREDYDYRLRNGINDVLWRKRGIRELRFGDLESQLEGLKMRSTSASWGCRMRAAAAAASDSRER